MLDKEFYTTQEIEPNKFIPIYKNHEEFKIVYNNLIKQNTAS